MDETANSSEFLIPKPLDDGWQLDDPASYLQAFEFRLDPQFRELDISSFDSIEKVPTRGYSQQLSYKPQSAPYIKVYPVGLEFITRYESPLISHIQERLLALGLPVYKEQIVLTRSHKTVGLHIDTKVSCILTIPLLNQDKGLIWLADPTRKIMAQTYMELDHLYLLNVTQFHGMIQDPTCSEYWFVRVFFVERSYSDVSRQLNQHLWRKS